MNFLRFFATPLLAAALLVGAATVFASPVASPGVHKQAAQPKKPAEFYYVCPMHDDVKYKKPGKCPKCKMKLEKKRINESTESPGQ